MENKLKENITIRLEKKDEEREIENLVREGFWNVYKPEYLYEGHNKGR